MDPAAGHKKQVELYQMLTDLIRAEDTCKEKVRESEEEVQEILNDRTKEESVSECEISVYDTMRNEKAKKHRKELVGVAFIKARCKWFVVSQILMYIDY